MNRLAKGLVAATTLVIAASSAAVLLAPSSTQEPGSRRQARAQRLIDQLTEGVWAYFRDRDEFPPGDGIGSASLVRSLKMNSPGGSPYMTFVDEMLTSTGDLRDPACPAARIVFYRNNQTGAGPSLTVHNRSNFDLWTTGADGAFDSVNNWGPPFRLRNGVTPR